MSKSKHISQNMFKHSPNSIKPIKSGAYGWNWKNFQRSFKHMIENGWKPDGQIKIVNQNRKEIKRLKYIKTHAGDPEGY